jgi:hypothetical protein
MNLLTPALLVIALAAAHAGPVGYRGDGSGVFPQSNPPVDCDMTTGRNIVWTAPLPNWGHGSPIVVKDRAFVLSEPGWKHDWPVLTCLDVATGKVLWEREVNHLPATKLDAGKQAEIATQWREFHETWRKLYTTFAETVGQKKPEEAVARFEQMGFKFAGHRGGGYGQLRGLKPKPEDRFGGPAGIHGETWRHGCGLGTDCIGMAYATPVSDGEHVYVTTTFSGAACYDLAGNQKWVAFAPTTGRTEAYARSPLLYRDLLISDYFGRLVAFDKTTGKVRWQVETKGGSIATSAIITVAGTDIVLSEGKQDGDGSVTATRLPDGKPLRVEGWGIGGTQILTDTDRRDVAYFCGRGQHSFWPEKGEVTQPPVAVRFALDGETLKATMLWHGAEFVGAGGYVGLTYHGGKLYCSTGGSAVVIDAATGKLLAGELGKNAKRVLPATSHLLLLAGDKFYGLGGSGGAADGNIKTSATLTCFSRDGAPLGKSVLTAAPVEGEKLAQTRSQVGWDKWPFAYGFPFTIAGDRIYVRGFDHLICIGAKP